MQKIISQVLSNLSNIFERIIHQQVCLFFEDTPSEHQFG